MPSEHCREFDDRSRELTSLDLLLNDARLTDHARTCAACSARHTEMLRLQSAITAMRSAPPAVDLTATVLQQWRNEQRTASPAASTS
ncbi:MAG: hypothetical protein KDA79_10465, partial [Planctomycetaceae bacterium]|nr:hypothetical protein [Planctomycetaceae bacterium]